MTDHRSATRNRTFLPARIEIADLGTALSCTIRDLSEIGARLQVSGSVVLPPAFRLHIPKFDRTLQAAQRWRRGEFIGVQFEAEMARAPTSGGPEREGYIRKLEGENARLKVMLEAIREEPSRALLILERDAA